MFLQNVLELLFPLWRKNHINPASKLMGCKRFDKSIPNAFSTSRISTSNELPINSNIRSKIRVILLILATQLPQFTLDQKRDQVGHFNLFLLRITERSDLSSRNNWFARFIFNIDESGWGMTDCTDYFALFPELFCEGNGHWVSRQVDDGTVSAHVEDCRII